MRPDKAKIQHSFAAAADSYDSVAGLQRQVGTALLVWLDAASLAGTVLDLGCGTGFLTGLLAAQPKVDSLIAVDIALTMLHTTLHKTAAQQRIRPVCADAEYLPFAGQSVDWVVSNLALQWCTNLGAVFSGIKQVLKPQGQLVFSTFGPQTLHELKSAWAGVDDHKHVNNFYSAQQIGVFLQQAGFTDIQLESTLYISHYGSVRELMQELKQLGAHHVIEGGNKRLTTKTAMQAMMAAYETFRTEGQIPASFEVIRVMANN
ncbi:MAG: malonyl-ACP O-methyltransferase BioC [Methylococcales bacterium]|nr:malonyl-ACP O-methyltransferase BioC [Methylococcales bacterium]